MKHLKLFESFSETEKVNAVHGFFFDFFLFKFFVDYNIGVRYTEILSFARTKDHTKPQPNKVIEFSIKDKALVSASRYNDNL